MVTTAEDGVMVTEGGNFIGSRPMMEKVLYSWDVELKHRVKRMAGGRMFIVGQEVGVTHKVGHTGKLLNWLHYEGNVFM